MKSTNVIFNECDRNVFSTSHRIWSHYISDICIHTKITAVCTLCSTFLHKINTKVIIEITHEVIEWFTHCHTNLSNQLTLSFPKNNITVYTTLMVMVVLWTDKKIVCTFDCGCPHHHPGSKRIIRHCARLMKSLSEHNAKVNTLFNNMSIASLLI